MAFNLAYELVFQTKLLDTVLTMKLSKVKTFQAKKAGMDKMLADVHLPSFLNCGGWTSYLEEVNFWKGEGRQQTLLHNDNVHNVNCTPLWSLITSCVACTYSRDETT
jgi:hypothetical protein